MLTYPLLDRPICGSNRFSSTVVMGTVRGTTLDEASGIDVGNCCNPFDETGVYQIPFFDSSSYTTIGGATICKNVIFN